MKTSGTSKHCHNGGQGKTSWPIRRRCRKCSEYKVYVIEDLKICASCFKHIYLLNGDFISTCTEVLNILLCFIGEYLPREMKNLVLGEAKLFTEKDPEAATAASLVCHTHRNEGYIEGVGRYIAWRENRQLERRVYRTVLEIILQRIYFKNSTIFHELTSTLNRPETLLLVFLSLKNHPGEYFSLLAEGQEEKVRKVESLILLNRIKVKIDDDIPFRILDQLREAISKWDGKLS